MADLGNLRTLAGLVFVIAALMLHVSGLNKVKAAWQKTGTEKATDLLRAHAWCLSTSSKYLTHTECLA